MIQMIRHCPDCGAGRLFEPHHAADCPDAADGDCREWFCAGCGAALLIGCLPPLPEAAGTAPARARAA